MTAKKAESQPKHKFNYDDLPVKESLLHAVPYYAYVSNDPNFVALTFTGKTPEDAYRVALSHATLYYKGKSNVIVRVMDEQE